MAVKNKNQIHIQFATSLLLGHDLQMNKSSTSLKGPLNNFLKTILISEIKWYFSENKEV